MNLATATPSEVRQLIRKGEIDAQTSWYVQWICPS